MKRNRPGFTLVETIISLVVLAMVMYSVISIFITSGSKGANLEIFSVAGSLAEGKMEQTLAKSFAAVSSEAPSSCGGDLSGFSSEVFVVYVSQEALDISAESVTNYKKITVSITHPQLSSPASLESIRGDQ